MITETVTKTCDRCGVPVNDFCMVLYDGYDKDSRRTKKLAELCGGCTVHIEHELRPLKR